MKFWVKAGIGAAVLGGAGFAAVGSNKHLVVTDYTMVCNGLPAAFDGLKIAQLSDLHASSFGKNQKKLLKKLETIAPDLVVITGDLIDRRRTRTDKDMKPALVLLKELADRFPAVRVDGNHEVKSPASARFRALADTTRVQNVTGRGLKVCKGDDHIIILGIPDVAQEGDDSDSWRRRMHKVCAPYASSFRLALSHRPQYLEDYAKEGLPLVLCGHAHGGQFRLPFLGGLVAPNQGLFPEYDSGLHTSGNTNMIVSRGIGNSLCPIRFNNRPEVIFIDLKSRTI